MLFALGHPAAFVGLLLAFLLALAVRAVATRLVARVVGVGPRRVRLRPDPRVDIDPFGAVAALLGGTGWGRGVDLDELPRFRDRGRYALVVAAGPVTVLVLGLVALTAYRSVFPDGWLALAGNTASDVLRGRDLAPGAGGSLLLALAIGLLCFGFLNLVPLPPLDGFALLWLSLRDPGTSAQQARHWLVDNNLGVVFLLALFLFPFGTPLLHLPLNLLVTPLMRLWS